MPQNKCSPAWPPFLLFLTVDPLLSPAPSEPQDLATCHIAARIATSGRRHNPTKDPDPTLTHDEIEGGCPVLVELEVAVLLPRPVASRPWRVRNRRSRQEEPP